MTRNFADVRRSEKRHEARHYNRASTSSNDNADSTSAAVDGDDSVDMRQRRGGRRKRDQGDAIETSNRTDATSDQPTLRLFTRAATDAAWTANISTVFKVCLS